MHRLLIVATCGAALSLGCQSTVHPRVGTGVPAPTWFEVEKKPLFSEDKAPASEPGPRTIGARHVLVMYHGAAHAAATIGRTREEAFRRAQEALQRLRNGEDFATVVEEYTDEPGGAARGGTLGRFTRERMVKAFSEAAFVLEPGELSDIVETQYGFHIIQRTE